MQSNLFVHVIKTLKFIVRSFGAKECLSRKCLPTDEAKHVFYFETIGVLY